MDFHYRFSLGVSIMCSHSGFLLCVSHCGFALLVVTCFILKQKNQVCKKIKIYNKHNGGRGTIKEEFRVFYIALHCLHKDWSRSKRQLIFLDYGYSLWSIIKWEMYLLVSYQKVKSYKLSYGINHLECTQCCYNQRKICERWKWNHKGLKDGLTVLPP